MLSDSDSWRSTARVVSLADISIRRADLAKLGIGYERIPNDAARSLSPFACGLLVEALSHRPDWKHLSADDMWRSAVMTRGKDAAGRRTYRAGYAELEREGFRHRLRRSQSGHHSTDVRWYNLPVRPCDEALSCESCKAFAGVPITVCRREQGKGGVSAGHAGVPDSVRRRDLGKDTVPAARAGIPDSVSLSTDGTTDGGESNGRAPRAPVAEVSDYVQVEDQPQHDHNAAPDLGRHDACGAELYRRWNGGKPVRHCMRCRVDVSDGEVRPGTDETSRACPRHQRYGPRKDCRDCEAAARDEQETT